MKPAVVLVGPPGSGKTTVGGLLADAIGLPFRDTDADIVSMAGKTIPEIFIDDGEDHFRVLEGKALGVALASHGGVLALGGGAVMAPANRALLTGHTVVFLSVGLADAVKRVGLETGRPLLSVNPRATLRAQLDQRRPLYQEVATYTVDTDGKPPRDVTAEIVALLGGS